LFCAALLSSSLAWAQSEPESDSKSEKDHKISIGTSSAEFGSTADTAGIEVGEFGRNKAESDSSAANPADADTEKKKRGEFAATPIPVVNPTIGNGLGGIGMYAVHLDKNDTVSPPSVFGGGGFATDNGSWMIGAGAKLHLRRDLFRILGGAATGRLNYDFFGIGNDDSDDGSRPSIPLTQKVSGFLIEPKIRFLKGWYIGPRYHLMKNTIGLDWDKIGDPDTERPPDLPELDFQLQTAALGFRVEWDTRDNQFYPRKGSLLDFKTDFFSPKLGADRAYQSIEIAYQGFIGFQEKNVIAFRIAACGTSDEAPFYDICLLGLSKDLRGYQVGEYRDYRMLAGQVEYRRELFWRLGLTGFFGMGEVAPRFSDFNTKNLKPGGGFGVRFLLAKENHVNLRVDFAWGEDNSAIYIGLGEVF